MPLTGKLVSRVCKRFCKRHHDKKIRLRILQGRPDARMARQQMGVGGSHKDCRKRTGTLQRTVSQYPDRFRKSLGAGAQATHRRRPHPPATVPRRAAQNGVLHHRLRQNPPPPRVRPSPLGSGELRTDYGE